jgi:molecular chaperone IbpA
MTRYRVEFLNQLDPWFLGFDHIFNDVDHFLVNNKRSTYPPHNIIETEPNKFLIEMALAGFKKADLNITVSEGVLAIEHVKQPEPDSTTDTKYRGIAKREFKKVFNLAEDIEVIDASLEDGLLKIQLEKIIPEEKKPKTIPIN